MIMDFLKKIWMYLTNDIKIVEVTEGSVLDRSSVAIVMKSNVCGESSIVDLKTFMVDSAALDIQYTSIPILLFGKEPNFMYYLTSILDIERLEDAIKHISQMLKENNIIYIMMLSIKEDKVFFTRYRIH